MLCDQNRFDIDCPIHHYLAFIHQNFIVLTVNVTDFIKGTDFKKGQQDGLWVQALATKPDDRV